ncbi:SGNH/GDSL hydrolase family protein [Mariniflexile gromovii]|uniref:SGNH/GDSL hydrolase family protein n=1 Tax=Mariniflexile gromovii TaxID=362523 RepID=A0ABS4BU94_9FLAO|nr:SGNH/GDSL hydrolase family protein [Mariniflexile gromovii]MBP0904159.1 SGNH/GDSL hydrolase family protein [Mariniflexile gromovii]
MKHLKIIVILIIVVCAFSGFKKEKAKILIVGDSISIGYTSFVKESLSEVAEVFHNPGNAQHTGTGLQNIEKWIGDEKWDIIQINWGLWDLCYRHPDSKVQGQRDKVHGTITFNPEAYEKNLDAIVKLIRKKSNAKIIFVSTTYVPEQEAGRFSKDAIIYNKISRRVMEAHSVIINDIYDASKEIHSKYGKGNDDVHYTPKGYEALGEHIAGFLKQELQ